jgi:hypothetical protein
MNHGFPYQPGYTPISGFTVGWNRFVPKIPNKTTFSHAPKSWQHHHTVPFSHQQKNHHKTIVFPSKTLENIIKPWFSNQKHWKNIIKPWFSNQKHWKNIIKP